MQKIWEAIVAFLGGTLAMIFGAAWAFGGPVGAIWAAVNDDLLNVVLSIMIPFYGAYYTIAQLLE